MIACAAAATAVPAGALAADAPVRFPTALARSAAIVTARDAINDAATSGEIETLNCTRWSRMVFRCSATGDYVDDEATTPDAEVGGGPSAREEQTDGTAPDAPDGYAATVFVRKSCARVPGTWTFRCRVVAGKVALRDVFQENEEPESQG